MGTLFDDPVDQRGVVRILSAKLVFQPVRGNDQTPSFG